jgi:MFS family permease
VSIRGRLPRLDRNGRLLVAAKAVRSFGFGMNAVALGLYLSALGLEAREIGLILSAALFGTLTLTLVIALYGDRIGRRRLLLAGAALMPLAALIPFVGPNPLLLAIIGLSGMVSVTANEGSGLQSVDIAVLPQTVTDRERTGAFAVYNIAAVFASALGALVAGIIPAVGAIFGQGVAAAYSSAFLLYALLGVVAFFLAWRLDPRIEVAAPVVPVQRRLAIHRSRRTVGVLSLLFGFDTLASGFVVQSFLAFWLATRFDAAPEVIGTLFFASAFLNTASFPVAVWLANRIGAVRTMVFTHIPANVFLIGMALVPEFLPAAVLFLARAALSSMDIPVRQSYTMAVVDPDERTATAGVTNLARSIGQTPGPGIASLLLVPLGLGVPLIAAGMMKIGYDVALFLLFRRRPTPEEALRESDAQTVLEGRGPAGEGP